jgi:hypothetical protein
VPILDMQRGRVANESRHRSTFAALHREGDQTSIVDNDPMRAVSQSSSSLKFVARDCSSPFHNPTRGTGPNVEVSIHSSID